MYAYNATKDCMEFWESDTAGIIFYADVKDIPSVRENCFLFMEDLTIQTFLSRA